MHDRFVPNQAQCPGGYSIQVQIWCTEEYRCEPGTGLVVTQLVSHRSPNWSRTDLRVWVEHMFELTI